MAEASRRRRSAAAVAAAVIVAAVAAVAAATEDAPGAAATSALAAALAPAPADAADDDDECYICMSQPRTVRLRPCGHACSCAQCTIRMVDVRRRSLRCPICKREALLLDWGQQQLHHRTRPPSWRSHGAVAHGAAELSTRVSSVTVPLRRLATYEDDPRGGEHAHDHVYGNLRGQPQRR